MLAFTILFLGAFAGIEGLARLVHKHLMHGALCGFLYAPDFGPGGSPARPE
jgi:hypothetical protein